MSWMRCPGTVSFLQIWIEFSIASAFCLLGKTVVNLDSDTDHYGVIKPASYWRGKQRLTLHVYMFYCNLVGL